MTMNSQKRSMPTVINEGASKRSATLIPPAITLTNSDIPDNTPNAKVGTLPTKAMRHTNCQTMLFWKKIFFFML